MDFRKIALTILITIGMVLAIVCFVLTIIHLESVQLLLIVETDSVNGDYASQNVSDDWRTKTVSTIGRNRRTLQDPNFNTTERIPTTTPTKSKSKPSLIESFSATSIKRYHLTLYKEVLKLFLKEGLFFNWDDEVGNTPFEFLTPEKLKSEFDFKLGQNSVDLKTLMSLIRKIINFSPHVSHPYMVHSRMTGIDPYALIGDWLSTILSAVDPGSPYLTPVLDLMEHEILEKVRNLVGYEHGSGDGIIIPSGSWANIYAIRMALENKFPQAKEKGMHGIGNPEAIIFISELASTYIEKEALFQGIGTFHCIRIRTDNNGRMDVNDLISLIEHMLPYSRKPFMIIATAGTSVLGVIDPIAEIAKVAKKYNIWLHVDAQVSGSAIFSNLHKKRLAGIELSDSFSWCPSSMFGVPFDGEILVTKWFNVSQALDLDTTRNSRIQNYFRNRPSGGNSNVIGRTLKIWVWWKSRGHTQLGEHIECIFDKVHYCTQELQEKREIFELVLDSNNYDSHLVAFYYIPTQLKNFTKTERETILKYSQFVPKLKVKLLLDRTMQISEKKLSHRHGYAQCFVMNLAANGGALSKADITYLIDTIEFYGRKLELEVDWKKEINWILHTTRSQGEFLSDPVARLLPPDTRNNSPPTPNPKAMATRFHKIKSAHDHENLFGKFFKLVLDNEIFSTKKQTDSPVSSTESKEFTKEFDFNLGDKPIKDDDLLAIINKLIKYSERTVHPYYVGFRMDPYAMAAQFVIAGINSPMTTYEDGPVFNLMENEIFRALRRKLNYPEDGTGDGITLPDSSFANILSINTAYFQNVNDMFYGRLKHFVIYVSEDASESFKKGAVLLGIGLENCVLIPTDASGRMSIVDLKSAILKSKLDSRVPFMIAAIIGTRSFGSIDPLEEIATVCKENHLWFHIDVSDESGIIMATNPKFTSILKGAELSDSVSIKMAATTILLTRHEHIFERAFGVNRFEDRLLYNGTYDNDKKYLAGGPRRAEILKVWLMWKAKGTESLTKQYHYVKAITDYVAEQMETKRNGNFKLLVRQPDLTEVAFYYIPPSMRKMIPTSNEYLTKLNNVSLQIYDELVRTGTMGIIPIEVRNLPIFLKFVITSSVITKDDCDYLIDLVEFYGNDL